MPLEPSDSMDELDPLLHQPLRTQVFALLAGAGEATFGDLKRRLEVSDGNLDAHLKKLLAAGYIGANKSRVGRPQTHFFLTPLGRQALSAYVQALHRMLPLSTASGANEEFQEPLSAEQRASSA